MEIFLIFPVECAPNLYLFFGIFTSTFAPHNVYYHLVQCKPALTQCNRIQSLLAFIFAVVT